MTIERALMMATSGTEVELFLWGGGGGGGYNAGAGGGGGAAYAKFKPVSTALYSIVVGGGGLARAAGAGPGAAVPGGGGLAGSLGYGGQGGGYSGIFLSSASQANAILIAGGGGGASWESANGGAGGGANGAAGGAGSLAGGGGGTQSAGGAGYSSGSALQGGQPTDGDSGGGGGGGGGYFGGGAGTNNNPGSAGGGGSGYASTALVTSQVLTAGSGQTPGDSSNSLRGSYGNGGSGTGAGTQGVVIIRYSGDQKFGGGTVTSSGGYTYHTFTSAGSFYSYSYVLPGDPYYISNVSLLAHFDGNFTDSSVNSVSLSARGSAQIAGTHFGGCVYFSRSVSSNVQASTNTEKLRFAENEDFTLELWMYQTALNDYPMVYEMGWHGYSGGCGFFAPGTGSDTVSAYLGGFGTLGSGSVSCSLNTWYHIAFVRYNNVVKIYVNGVGNTGVSYSGGISTPSLNPPAIGNGWGANGGTGGDRRYEFQGYIDDLRVTKGVARYTANFTPPTQAFPNL